MTSQQTSYTVSSGTRTTWNSTGNAYCSISRLPCYAFHQDYRCSHHKHCCCHHHRVHYVMYIRHPDDMGDLPSNKQNIQDIHSVSYGILVVPKSKLYAVSLALPVAQFNVNRRSEEYQQYISEETTKKCISDTCPRILRESKCLKLLECR